MPVFGEGPSSVLNIGDPLLDGTVGSVLFIGAGPVLQEDNPNFFWDDANNRLGLGNATPAAVLEINAATATHPGLIIQSTDDSGTNDLFQAQDAAGTTFISIGGDLPWVLDFQNTGLSVFIGSGAGANDDLSNNSNVFIGATAGNQNISGIGNVALGSNALANNLTGSNNLAMGRLAMFQNTSGTSNTAIGFDALGAGNSSNNTAIGSSAMGDYLGAFSVAIGGAALSRSSALNTVAVGYNALLSHVSGIGRNTALGTQAGQRLLGGTCTLLGYQAAEFATTCENTIAIGYQVADNLTTGDRCLAIGTDIDLPSATASNQMNIANLLYSEGIDGTANTLSSGNLGVAIQSPLSRIHSGGSFGALVTTVTGTTHTAADEYVILVDDDTAGAAVTVTLPAASGVTDRVYHIKKLGTTANVTVDGNSSETIDGATTAVLTAQFESLMISCDGSNWHII